MERQVFDFFFFKDENYLKYTNFVHNATSYKLTLNPQTKFDWKLLTDNDVLVWNGHEFRLGYCCGNWWNILNEIYSSKRGRFEAGLSCEFQFLIKKKSSIVNKSRW